MLLSYSSWASITCDGQPYECMQKSIVIFGQTIVSLAGLLAIFNYATCQCAQGIIIFLLRYVCVHKIWFKDVTRFKFAKIIFQQHLHVCGPITYIICIVYYYQGTQLSWTELFTCSTVTNIGLSLMMIYSFSWTYLFSRNAIYYFETKNA